MSNKLKANYTESVFGKGVFDEPIIVPEDTFFLSDILTDDHYKELFNRENRGKIFVLNKNRCGNGGTTSFINYARNHNKGLIVSVPNRSIVFSKEKDNKDLCCVVGGAKNLDMSRNIRISTWDKTESVESTDQYGFCYIDMNDLENWRTAFWSGSLLLVDEYHKLVEDNSYRDEVCGKITSTIINNEGCVVLMSATPNYEYINFLKQFKEVVIIDIQYDDKGEHHDGHIISWYDRPKGVETYNILNHLWENIRNRAEKTKRQNGESWYKKRKKEKGELGQMVVFYSSVDSITSFVENLPDELVDKVEVLCSTKHKDVVPNYSEAFNPDKSLHFLTSAYFTGMDIYTHIDLVVIIGSNSEVNLAYSNREIKQMLGRFRCLYDENKSWLDGGYEAVYVITDGKTMDEKGYIDAVNKEGKYEFRTHDVADENKREMTYIEDYMEYLYYSCEIKKREGWVDSKSFIKMMSDYKEYSIRTHKLPEVRSYKKKRDISFKRFKDKRLQGIKVKHRLAAKSEYYIEKRGLEAFANASRNEIERFYTLNTTVGDVDLESLSAEYKYDLLLGDRYYHGSYLMSVLEYLGEAPKDGEGKLDYSMLEVRMKDVFGCLTVYVSGDKSHPSSCWFLCILPNYTENRRNRGKSLYIRLARSNYEISYNDIQVSRNTADYNQKSNTSTEILMEMNLPSVINGTGRVHKDKGHYQKDQKEHMTKLLNEPSLIAEYKNDPRGKEAFDYYKNYHQSLVSEFYDDTGKKGHPFKKEEMSKIDCIIVDIDGGIRYYDFRDKYSDIEWMAIPTISNTDADNWTKFRVIYPLAQTLEIPNESLKVLKMLRSMVCPFEDRCHQMGSYMNQEQWAMRRHNVGLLYDIGQDIVVYLDSHIKNLTFCTGKFKKAKKDGGFSTSNYWWDMNRAIAYYQEHDKDGERHTATFVIKNRLSEEDCIEFEKWFAANHYDKMHHWKSHKRIAS